ncbi:MAG: MobF family relaxase, partial [Mycobacteriales bacterium]
MHAGFRGSGTSAGTNPGTKIPFAGQVLSIAKLRVGQEAYQLSGVAQSLDDYYTGAGEAAGRWIGAGAERLGLAGEVVPDDLRAVLAGMAPGSGGLTPNGETIRAHPRRVPGFDLTFKTPKSVSVLYAVSDDPRVQGAIIDAGETAVREALGWLEREAIHVRRGTGNEAFLDDLAARDPHAAAAARLRALPGQGVVAATFRHRTSRAGDPLLHWHTLVANLVEGPDGRWSAFHSPRLYRSVRAAGEVFQTVLRAELTQRLGIEWRPGRHVPEIAGVPQALCDLFSKRSREIEDWLEATGTPDSPAGRQEAVLATRRNKPEVEHERFDTAWKAEALDVGWGPDAAEALIASAGDGRVPDVAEVWRLPEQVETPTGAIVVDGVVDPEEWVAHLCRQLTETDSTFTRPQLVAAVAARIGEGATMATLERVVARVMASPVVVPVGDDGGRWTSVELLAVERRFLHTADTARATRAPLPPSVVDPVIGATPTLGSDQAAAVRALTGTSDGVAVLVGPAGTGKTYTLDTIR